MNFKNFKAAFGQAVATGTSYAKDLSTQVVGAKILRDYVIGQQVASSGLWKIYGARCKREGSATVLVSVWLLDRKPPAELRHSESTWDAYQDLVRKDVAHLTRLKHPGIVKLVEPYEETRAQMVMVTEAVMLSLHDVVTHGESLPAAARLFLEELKMSELERKHGLMQVADTLQFLHSEANLIHSGLCPAAVILTAAGSWKLASLAHTSQVEYAVGESAPRTFDYTGSGSGGRLLFPPLQYVAPELIETHNATRAPQTPASDMFSLGCLLFELLARRPLLPPDCSVSDHQGRVSGLAFMDFGSIPVDAQQLVKSMLSGIPSVRPSASAFLGASFFQDDVLVRSLRFLDNLLQRDNLQKTAFLKDALKFWPRFDHRVLRYKVLPPLLTELRNEQLQALVLPLVLNIIPLQEPQDFMDWTLPGLLPVAASAKGEALTVFTRNAALLATTMPEEAVRQLIVPLLMRAADQGDAAAQEEMVKAVPMLAEIVTEEDLKANLLPRLCGLCLGTTSAAVRSQALVAMGKLLPSIELDEAKKMLTICGKVTSVDTTPGTIMCVIGLGTAVAKRYGAEAAARTSLPVMGPCLAAPALTPSQYSTAMRAVREILASLDASKGVATQVPASNQSSASGLPTLDLPPVGATAPAFKQSPTGGANNALFGMMSSMPPAVSPQYATPPAAGFDHITGGGVAVQPPSWIPPPPPPTKAGSLADAFSSLNSAPSFSSMPAPAQPSVAASDIDSMFDFQLPQKSTGSNVTKAAVGAGPLLGQPPAAATRQTLFPQQQSVSTTAASPRVSENLGSGSLI